MYFYPLPLELYLSITGWSEIPDSLVSCMQTYETLLIISVGLTLVLKVYDLAIELSPKLNFFLPYTGTNESFKTKSAGHR